MINAFEEIKARLDLREVAERYGVEVDRHNKALCFVHDDHRPSLSFKGGRYKCFSCGAGGDVLDMVAHIRGISILEAAKLLDADYGLGFFPDKPLTAAERKAAQEAAQQAQIERETLAAFEDRGQQASMIIADYLRLLDIWRSDFAPKIPDEPWDEHFCEAINSLAQWEYLFDYYFLGSGVKLDWNEEKREWLKDEKQAFELQAEFYELYAREVAELGKRLYAV